MVRQKSTVWCRLPNSAKTSSPHRYTGTVCPFYLLYHSTSAPETPLLSPVSGQPEGFVITTILRYQDDNFTSPEHRERGKPSSNCAGSAKWAPRWKTARLGLGRLSKWRINIGSLQEAEASPRPPLAWLLPWLLSLRTQQSCRRCDAVLHGMYSRPHDMP